MSDQIIGSHSFTPYPTTTTYGDSITYANCHRCGKPAGGSYLNGMPTCAWCLAELNKLKHNPYPVIEPHVDAYWTGPIPQTLKVKYFSKEILPLEYIGKGISDWVDLRLAEDFIMEKGQFRLLPLGVAIELPKGYEAIIAPRSSTFKKFGLLEANSIGVIDEAYCGDNDMWRFAAYATRKVMIDQNTRICQFRIIEHQPPLIFETVEHLGNPDRNGFGSTGHK